MTIEERAIADHFGYKIAEWNAKSELAKKAALYAYENYSGKETGIAVGNAYIAGATDMVQRAVEIYEHELKEIVAVINRFSKDDVGEVISIEGSVKDFEKAMKGE